MGSLAQHVRVPHNTSPHIPQHQPKGDPRTPGQVKGPEGGCPGESIRWQSSNLPHTGYYLMKTHVGERPVRRRSGIPQFEITMKTNEYFSKMSHEVMEQTNHVTVERLSEAQLPLLSNNNSSSSGFLHHVMLDSKE